MVKVAGSTVVLTGAGSGVGQALAWGLVQRGAHVVGIGHRADSLRSTEAACSGPGSFQGCVADVGDAQALQACLASTIRSRQAIDLLINCAAVYPRAELRATEPGDWERGVDTNLNGVVHACRALLLSQPEGHAALVLNVGSFAHLGPETASTLYCATKAAVSAFSKALAVELRAAGSPVIVNEWVPGMFRTRMSPEKGEAPAVAMDYLLAVWEKSLQGGGGRVFRRAEEVLPPMSRKQKLLSWLRRRRG